MIGSFRAMVVVALLAAITITTHSGAAFSQAPAGRAGQASAKAGPNPADVEFMSGMIPHHAQAVIMAGWAKSHGARSDVLALCERTAVGQADEIKLMQFWLREHGQPIPSATDTKMKMKMNGMDHDMLMPGMLTDEQMAQLDKSRGSDFDRLFLEGMIGHHGGAITMVNQLLASEGAAQDDLVYKMSSDIYADQTTEIVFMQKMLTTVPPLSSGRAP